MLPPDVITRPLALLDAVIVRMAPPPPPVDPAVSMSQSILLFAGFWLLIGFVTLCASLILAIETDGNEAFDETVTDPWFLTLVVGMGPVSTYLLVKTILAARSGVRKDVWPPEDGSQQLSSAWSDASGMGRAQIQHAARTAILRNRSAQG